MAEPDWATSDKRGSPRPVTHDDSTGKEQPYGERMPMRPHFGAALLAGALIAVGCGSGSPQAGSSTSLQVGDLRSALVELARADEVPGVAYAVVDEDGIVEAGGFGLADVENDVTATADTLFHIGSTHKAMNAYLIATLVDQGVLDWDTALVDLVPEAQIDPAITVRHLLTMTGGVPAAAEDDLPIGSGGGTTPTDRVFTAVEEAPPVGGPGEVFEYSNISAAAAGYAAVLAARPNEVNVHAGYLELFENRVLEPLAMSDSTLLVSEARENGTAGRRL